MGFYIFSNIYSVFFENFDNFENFENFENFGFFLNFSAQNFKILKIRDSHPVELLITHVLVYFV